MSNARQAFANIVAWPWVLLVLTPIATLVSSELTSWVWPTWRKTIPSWAYTSFFCACVVIFGVYLIFRRIIRLRQCHLPTLPSVRSIPAWGYEFVGTLTYKNVRWRLQTPASAPWRGFALSGARSARVDVQIPPRCPKCNSGIEEAETFLGSYRWFCLRCDFACKNNVSFYHEAMRAQKLAQADRDKTAQEHANR
jgi:hypothetical protein